MKKCKCIECMESLVNTTENTECLCDKFKDLEICDHTCAPEEDSNIEKEYTRTPDIQ